MLQLARRFFTVPDERGSGTWADRLRRRELAVAGENAKKD
jgi:hypothetical protein